MHAEGKFSHVTKTEPEDRTYNTNTNKQGTTAGWWIVWHPVAFLFLLARRGKNVYKAIWKDETVRTMVSAQVDSFKEEWAKRKEKTQANLMPPGQRWDCMVCSTSQSFCVFK